MRISDWSSDVCSSDLDGEAVKSSLTAAFKRGHGGFQLCKEGPGPGCVERCVEACTHPALGKRQALSLKIDRAGRDRNPRAGSTRIAVCADDICGHGDPRQIISRRLCVGVSLDRKSTRLNSSD